MSLWTHFLVCLQAAVLRFIHMMAPKHRESWIQASFWCRRRRRRREPCPLRWQSAMLTLLHHCGRNLLTFRTVQTVQTSFYTTQMGKRVAVVLAGCGVYDGSEIHEASAVLVHLSRGGASVSLIGMDPQVLLIRMLYCFCKCVCVCVCKRERNRERGTGVCSCAYN